MRRHGDDDPSWPSGARKRYAFVQRAIDQKLTGFLVKDVAQVWVGKVTRDNAGPASALLGCLPNWL